MNNLDILIDCIEQFIYEMGVYKVFINDIHFENDCVSTTLLDIKCKVLRYGRIEQYETQYIMKDEDVECEFSYTLAHALSHIANVVSNNMVKNYLMNLHDKGVI